MSSDKLQRLHNVHTSAVYNGAKEKPYYGLIEKPHLAVFINGDWMPILPGFIIGMMKNVKHVDGIAPYVLRKVVLTPGKERLDLEAWSTNPGSGRKLQFLANHSGVFRSGINDSDEAVDAASAAVKMANGTDEGAK